MALLGNLGWALLGAGEDPQTSLSGSFRVPPLAIRSWRFRGAPGAPTSWGSWALLGGLGAPGLSWAGLGAEYWTVAPASWGSWALLGGLGAPGRAWALNPGCWRTWVLDAEPWMLNPGC